MGKKQPRDTNPETSDAIKTLFSSDNPFHRKPQPPDAAAGARKRKRDNDKESGNPNPSPNPSLTAESIPNKRNKPDAASDGERERAEKNRRKRKRKRKRDELEEAYERKRYGEDSGKASEGKTTDVSAPVVVGTKRKSADATEEMAVATDTLDDESKLLRTVFIGNLPLKMKRKALIKEFKRFGEIDSVRIRSVPIVDSKVHRKGAIIKGKINEAVDSMHAYIVFKDEQAAHAALSHNMVEVGGNHIRVGMACPPRKKYKGEAPLYDKKRTLFVGNLPFDVKDEELYQLLCGASQLESTVEAVRVIRDPQTSLGKGIAYILFKTREAANSIVGMRNLKIRDRPLRLCFAKLEVSPPKRKEIGPYGDLRCKRLALSTSEVSSVRKDEPNAAPLSYQGLRASKSGILKKTGLRPLLSCHAGHGSKRVADPDQKVRKAKRPAVAARKAKLQKKRKQESGTPQSTHKSKKLKKH